MSNISGLRKLADNLSAKNNHEDAFLIYDEVYSQIWGAIGSVFQGLSKFSYDFLSYKIKSSIEFKNLFIEPSVNSIFKKWFEMDADETLNEFIFSAHGRLKCLVDSNVLLARQNMHTTINDFLVLYNLVLYSGSEKWIKTVLRIITPLIEDNRIKKIRPNFHESEIKKQILTASQSIKQTDWKNINLVMLDYLKKTGEENSDFYKALYKVVHSDSYESNNFRSKKRRYNIETADEEEKLVYYSSIIGIEGPITRIILRKKYLEVISKFHPDKFQNYGEETLKMAEKKSKEINIAYEWLCDKYPN
jgi:hypothetical protein